uniref:Uncharacterized protein n=1 Tax=Arundo donax TaxID=35708 RepID=A0A0A9E959_ARUDO
MHLIVLMSTMVYMNSITN